LDQANNYRRTHFEEAKRYIPPELGDDRRLAESYRNQPKNERELVSFLKEMTLYTLEAFTSEYPDCMAVAGL